MPQVYTPVRAKEPYFSIDPAFWGSSYGKQDELLCRRLVLEQLYHATCLTLVINAVSTGVSHPFSEIGSRQFAAKVQGHADDFAQSRLS